MNEFVFLQKQNQTDPVAGLHLLASQEPLHNNALVRKLALEGGSLSGRHRHVLQRAGQANGAR